MLDSLDFYAKFLELFRTFKESSRHVLGRLFARIKSFSGRESRRFWDYWTEIFRREKLFLATHLPMDWRNQFWRKPVLREVAVDQLYNGCFWDTIFRFTL